MEAHLGYDFSQVRVHLGGRPAESTRAMGSLAYTVGQDIVFGPGQYAPSTSAGRRLLAHELVHVIQQRGGGELIQHGGRLVPLTPREELEWDVGILSPKFDQFNGLSYEEKLRTMETVLHLLRRISANPYFANVDPELKREIASNVVQIEATLTAFARQTKANLKTVEESPVNWAAVGVVALIDGPEPGPADAFAGLAALGMWLFASAAVTTVLIDPDLPRRQAKALAERLQAIKDSLLGPITMAAALKRAEPVPTPVEESTPAPARPPQKIDPIAPLLPRPDLDPQPDPDPDPRQDDRRRRKRCSTDWVPRQEDTESQRYHNDFAQQMVTALRIAASPELEFRVYRGSATDPLDYDSHDAVIQDFFEFKTRYQYLPYEQLGVTWFATSGMVAQARDQKATMLACGYHGQLVWVFDNQDVANAARPFLQGADAADRVIGHYWAPTRPAPRRGR